MDNLIEKNKDVQKYKDLFQDSTPVIRTTHDIFKDEIYQDAALSRKMKRLIGVAIGVRTGSNSCMTNQTRWAVEAGATKEEVLEAVSVAVAMGGTSTIEYGGRVVKILEELGVW